MGVVCHYDVTQPRSFVIGQLIPFWPRPSFILHGPAPSRMSPPTCT